ncbi:MAG TPA: hypothetical protein VM290_08750 [Gaiellaceae bacterium]|jgi:hypothetical protein|nr:hypothetical protein [Gaiellaceae bacterium]
MDATTEHATIVDELETLLAALSGATPPALAELEETLTSGYAHALALEAERLRLERRIGTLAAGLGEAPQSRAQELVTLAQRLASADGDLDRLRALLAPLRLRVSALRAEAAAAPA